MKIYLNISFQQKDSAKAQARAANTSIRWDNQARRWYWQGQGDLPQALHQYQASRQSDAERRPYVRLSKGFTQSDSAAAQALGMSAEEMRLEDEWKHQQMLPSAEELKAIEAFLNA